MGSTAKNKQFFNTAVARRALNYSFCLKHRVCGSYSLPRLLLCGVLRCSFLPPEQKTNIYAAPLHTLSDWTDLCPPAGHCRLPPCNTEAHTVHPTPAVLRQAATGHNWRNLLHPLLPLQCFHSFCSGPASFSFPPHTDVTVLTLADSACLKRLFRSCMLGDFGLGMRGERLFSVAPLAEV